VTLIEYADLQCPGCDYYTVNVWPTLLDDYVRTGKVKNEFRGIAFLGSDSLKALRFVFAAGLQNRLWEFEDGLYRNQGKENSGWVTDDLLRNVAAQIPGLDVEKLFADANGGEVQQMIGQAEAQANAAGVSSTPTLFVQIGGRKPYRLVTAFDVGQLRAALDDALKG
jgi:protein-disulfide isomerase